MYKNFKKITFVFIITLFASCVPDNVDHEKLLIKTDKAFSKMSEESGMQKAFLHYMDSNVVILRDGAMPLVGEISVKEYYTTFADTNFTLTWTPLDVEISASKDLGFTYGTYKMLSKVDSSLNEGTYVSIWKKQKAGEWKFVLDTGNDGLN